MQRGTPAPVATHSATSLWKATNAIKNQCNNPKRHESVRSLIASIFLVLIFKRLSKQTIFRSEKTEEIKQILILIIFPYIGSSRFLIKKIFLKIRDD